MTGEQMAWQPHRGPRRATPGRPAGGWGPGLAEAKTAAQKAAQAVSGLYGDATVEQIRQAANLVQDVLTALQSVIAPPSRTGCTRHPHGPIDPDPPAGWGTCAMCNTNRQRGIPAAPVPQEIRDMLNRGRAERRAAAGR